MNFKRIAHKVRADAWNSLRASLIWPTVAIALHLPLHGAQALPEPIRDFEHDGAQISPDGNSVAVLTPNHGRVGLAVIDLASRRATWAYGDRFEDVVEFRWATTNRLLFEVGKDGYRYPGLWAVNKDGSAKKVLVGPSNPWVRVFSLVPDSSNEILVTSLEYEASRRSVLPMYPDLKRMNIFTGEKTVEVTNPGNVFGWVADHKGIVRVGLQNKDGRFRILYRASAGSKWETLADSAWSTSNMVPVGFEADNKTLLVKWAREGETDGLYTFDPATKTIGTLAFRHLGADVDSLITSRKTKRPVGIAYTTEKPEVFWFDTNLKRLQVALDRTLTNSVNQIVSLTDDETKAIVLCSNDRDPGSYFLADITTGKLEKLFDRAPWIHPEDMAVMKPIQYVARDGLTIHGYLSIPRTGGTNLPMVVMVHGGPSARDVWGYNGEVQFLAARGYAVLQVNFRGSTGYGRNFFEAGFRQWGLKQQDDITDGVRWAVKNGVADPKRVAIFGASYGGFAALTGLQKTPELYRCGICYAGVTDITRTLQSRLTWSRDVNSLKQYIAETVGDLKTDKQMLKETSPIANVDAIRVPVLMAYGELDPLVPIATGRSMARALEKRGKLEEFICIPDEGHGFFKEENKIKFWGKVDAFLQKHLNQEDR